jgi:hypothetical protein
MRCTLLSQGGQWRRWLALVQELITGECAARRVVSGAPESGAAGRLLGRLPHAGVVHGPPTVFGSLLALFAPWALRAALRRQLALLKIG